MEGKGVLAARKKERKKESQLGLEEYGSKNRKLNKISKHSLRL